MLKVMSALLGFAFFGAIFAAVIYEPETTERQIGPPKYGLAPGEIAADFIEPAALGENITVNITVLSGGPVHVYLMDMENLTRYVLNGTEKRFELQDGLFYDSTVTRFNVTEDYNFTFVADGENRWVVVFESAMEYNETVPLENQTTEVFVNMRYLDSETKSLIAGYILATPSVLLIGYTVYKVARRHWLHDGAPAEKGREETEEGRADAEEDREKERPHGPEGPPDQSQR